MSHPDSIQSQNPWRQRRLKAFGVLAGFFAFCGAYLHFSARQPTSYRFLFLGAVGVFVSLWRLEKRDLAFLQEQEDAAKADPKHIFQNAVGIAHSPDLRRWLAYSLYVLGGGMLYRAFEGIYVIDPILQIALIFWGAGCCIVASVLLFIY